MGNYRYNKSINKITSYCCIASHGWPESKVFPTNCAKLQCCGFESHPGQLVFLSKRSVLGFIELFALPLPSSLIIFNSHALL